MTLEWDSILRITLKQKARTSATLIRLGWRGLRVGDTPLSQGGSQVCRVGQRDHLPPTTTTHTCSAHIWLGFLVLFCLSSFRREASALSRLFWEVTAIRKGLLAFRRHSPLLPGMPPWAVIHPFLLSGPFSRQPLHSLPVSKVLDTSLPQRQVDPRALGPGSRGFEVPVLTTSAVIGRPGWVLISASFS